MTDVTVKVCETQEQGTSWTAITLTPNIISRGLQSFWRHFDLYVIYGNVCEYNYLNFVTILSLRRNSRDIG